MSDTPRNPLSPAAVRSLLNTAARLRQQGDTQRARAVLRILASQCPNNPWVWRALADVAENENERRAALRRVVALVRSAAAPETTTAGFSTALCEPPARAPNKIGAPPSAAAAQPPPSPSSPTSAAPSVPGAPLTAEPVTSPDAAPPSAAQSPSSVTPRTTPPAPSSLAASPASASSASVDQAPPQPVQTAPPSISRHKWIGVAAIGAALVIFAFLLTNARFPNTTTGPAPSPILATLEPAGGSTSFPSAPDLPASSLTTVPATPNAQPQSPVATMAPTATATPSPTLTPLPTLPAGTVILRDFWTLTLLRPDHTVVLNGPIGSRQPNGRFVLALVAVGNGGAAAALAPPELFVLIDDQGVRYRPEPGLSTLYLETFGRGRYGDFSLDESIPAGIGQVSVPVIFDVPVDARGLSLHLATRSPDGLSWDCHDRALPYLVSLAPRLAPRCTFSPAG